MISQECQLGKIPTNENKSWIGEALWITGGSFNLLPVVVSKLAIHSTTQEAPKTQQISQSLCPIRCKPNKLTAFLQGTRTVHICPQGGHFSAISEATALDPSWTTGCTAFLMQSGTR